MDNGISKRQYPLTYSTDTTGIGVENVYKPPLLPYDNYINYNKFNGCDRILREYIKNRNGGYAQMSLSVAIIGKDGIVVATDRRTTLYNRLTGMRTYHDAGKKLWLLKKRQLVAGITTVSSNRGYQDWLVNIFRSEVFDYKASNPKNKKDKSLEIHTFETLVKRFSIEMKKWYGFYTKDMSEEFINKDSFLLGFTLVGYNSKHEPNIYYLNSESSFVPSIYYDYYISGMPTRAEHYLERLRTHLFKETEDGFMPQANIDILKVLAVMLIRETHLFSDSVSNTITMKIFRDIDKVESVKDDEIKEIVLYVNSINTSANLLKLIKRSI